MKFKSNYEKSPFYVEYKGTTNYKKNTIAFHPKKDFNKDLRDFFKSKFGADAKDGEILEHIVYDYYFRFAHDRSYCGKTIIALIHEKHLALDNPELIPMFVLDRFPKDNEDDNLIDKNLIDNFDLMQYLAWSDKFKNVSDNLQKKIMDALYNDSYEFHGLNVFQDLKVFDKNTLNNFYVLEIPLNNHFDAEINGVYCYEDNDADGGAIESMHVGLAIVKDNDADVNAIPIPILYTWKLEKDFSIKIKTIEKVDVNILNDLCQKYNLMLNSTIKFFEIANSGYEHKLTKNLQKQKKLQEELEVLKHNEQNLRDLINQQQSDL